MTPPTHRRIQRVYLAAAAFLIVSQMFGLSKPFSRLFSRDGLDSWLWNLFEVLCVVIIGKLNSQRSISIKPNQLYLLNLQRSIGARASGRRHAPFAQFASNSCSSRKCPRTITGYLVLHTYYKASHSSEPPVLSHDGDTNSRI